MSGECRAGASAGVCEHASVGACGCAGGVRTVRARVQMRACRAAGAKVCGRRRQCAVGSSARA
jgi:hypothetical protein